MSGTCIITPTTFPLVHEVWDVFESPLKCEHAAWTASHLLSDIRVSAASNRIILKNVSDYLIETGNYWTSGFSLSNWAISAAWFLCTINDIFSCLNISSLLFAIFLVSSHNVLNTMVFKPKLGNCVQQCWKTEQACGQTPVNPNVSSQRFFLNGWEGDQGDLYFDCQMESNTTERNCSSFSFATVHTPI